MTVDDLDIPKWQKTAFKKIRCVEVWQVYRECQEITNPAILAIKVGIGHDTATEILLKLMALPESERTPPRKPVTCTCPDCNGPREPGKGRCDTCHKRMMKEMHDRCSK